MNNLKQKIHSLPKTIQIVFKSFVAILTFLISIAASIGIDYQIGRFIMAFAIGVFLGMKLVNFYRYLDR